MIVFDSSTPILMARIELLNPYLASVGQRVAIPREVERECCGVKKSFDALMIQKAIDESRVQVKVANNLQLVARLQVDFGLGRGEAEAVALAWIEKAQLLGIDDKNGINASKVMGVPFTTAMGILVRSREKGLLTHQDALAKLAALAQYGRYKRAIIEDAGRRLEGLK